MSTGRLSRGAISEANEATADRSVMSSFLYSAPLSNVSGFPPQYVPIIPHSSRNVFTRNCPIPPEAPMMIISEGCRVSLSPLLLFDSPMFPPSIFIVEASCNRPAAYFFLNRNGSDRSSVVRRFIPLGDKKLDRYLNMIRGLK